MREVTRTLVVAVLVVVGLLLALGAAPSALRSGDPYYVRAVPVATDEGAGATADRPAANASVNVSALSERRYPFVTGAVAAADGRANATGNSDPYWRGPFGVKGAFTHSPFDEFGALREQRPAATTDRAVYVRAGGPNATGTLYRLTIVGERR